MGREAYEKFFKPLLIGKFAEQYEDQVPMSFMWARIVKRTLKLGTYIGGFQAFLGRIGASIADARCDHPSEHADQAHLPSRRQARPGYRRRPFRPSIACSVRTSPRLLLRMAPDVTDSAYGEQVAALKSIGGLCVVFALKQPLMPDDTYWLNLPATTADKSRSAFPFLALVEHTNYISREHYGGDHIVYCGDYVPPTHEYFQLSEDELVDRFLPALHKVNPAFRRDWIRKSWVWRAPYAQPRART